MNIVPTEQSPPTREEIRARPELADCELIYRKWDLAEYSAVAVPGNADALTMIVQRGLEISEDAMALYEARLAAAEPVSLPEAQPAVVATADPLVEAIERWAAVRGRTFPEIYVELMGQIRSSGEQIKAEYRALYDLIKHGRV